MPPPKTIFVDVNHILQTIAAIAAEQVAEARAWRRPPDRLLFSSDVPSVAAAEWAPRDLQLLAGRLLTDSERKRHQQAVVKLEREGLVELDTRHIKLTNAGQRRVAQLERADDRELIVPPAEVNGHRHA